LRRRARAARFNHLPLLAAAAVVVAEEKAELPEGTLHNILFAVDMLYDDG